MYKPLALCMGEILFSLIFKFNKMYLLILLQITKYRAAYSHDSKLLYQVCQKYVTIETQPEGKKLFCFLHTEHQQQRLSLGRLSLAGPEILAFVCHCSANLQPILDCFKTKF